MPLVGFGPILRPGCCIVKGQMTQIMILKKNVHFQKLAFGLSLRHLPFLNLLIHIYRERGGLFKFIGVTDHMKFTARLLLGICNFYFCTCFFVVAFRSLCCLIFQINRTCVIYAEHLFFLLNVMFLNAEHFILLNVVFLNAELQLMCWYKL